MDIKFDNTIYNVATQTASEISYTPGYVYIATTNTANDDSTIGKLLLSYQVEFYGVRPQIRSLYSAQVEGNFTTTMDTLGSKGYINWTSFESSTPMIATREYERLKYLGVYNTEFAYVFSITLGQMIINPILMSFMSYDMDHRPVDLNVKLSLYKDVENKGRPIILAHIPP